MPRGKPVELETRSFATQAEATGFFRAMLRRYEPGQKVDDGDADDLLALLQRHPEAAQKIGAGVAGFRVDRAIEGTRCFYVQRKDGTGTDFSFGSCIKGKGPTRFQEVSSAFRREVRSAIHAKRDEIIRRLGDGSGRVPCAATGKLITREEGHMDHLPPMTFQVLVRTFLNARGLDLEAVPITERQDNQHSAQITDPELAKAFRDFHERTAELDFVAAGVNLAQSSRHRIRTSRLKK